jgi:biofilm protein TabA
VIYGHLSGPDAYAHLLVAPAWKLAFDWLKNATAATPAGIQQLQGDEVYVNVHGYETVPCEQGRFESHRRYVDLQYCLAGGEMIDWRLASELEPDGGYDGDKDVLFYRPPVSRVLGSRAPESAVSRGFALPATTLRMSPGSFAIFHPSDAHRPKVQDGVNPRVFKLVIKIDRKLVG